MCLVLLVDSCLVQSIYEGISKVCRLNSDYITSYYFIYIFNIVILVLVLGIKACFCLYFHTNVHLLSFNNQLQHIFNRPISYNNFVIALLISCYNGVNIIWRHIAMLIFSFDNIGPKLGRGVKFGHRITVRLFRL